MMDCVRNNLNLGLFLYLSVYSVVNSMKNTQHRVHQTGEERIFFVGSGVEKVNPPPRRNRCIGFNFLKKSTPKIYIEYTLRK